MSLITGPKGTFPGSSPAETAAANSTAAICNWRSREKMVSAKTALKGSMTKTRRGLKARGAPRARYARLSNAAHTTASRSVLVVPPRPKPKPPGFEPVTLFTLTSDPDPVPAPALFASRSTSKTCSATPNNRAVPPPHDSVRRPSPSQSHAAARPSLEE